ncbi:MAG: hypothetical protein Q7S11_04800 [bacterium]|nr:hypothetical protein [bacterium]
MNAKRNFDKTPYLHLAIKDYGGFMYPEACEVFFGNSTRCYIYFVIFWGILIVFGGFILLGFMRILAKYSVPKEVRMVCPKCKNGDLREEAIRTLDKRFSSKKKDQEDYFLVCQKRCGYAKKLRNQNR